MRAGHMQSEDPTKERKKELRKVLFFALERDTFNDKGGKSITLRPEFTAAIVRLLIEKKLPIRIILLSWTQSRYIKVIKEASLS
jgi:histidyl-tRNA synthetase